MRAIPKRGKQTRTDIPKPPLRMVLEYYGADNLPYRSGWIKIRCVVHDDSAPSMTVNLDDGGFNCHACGAKGGDAIQLVRLIENCDFPTALRKCEEITGEKYDSPTGSTPRGPSVNYVKAGTGVKLKVGSRRPRRPSL